MTGSEPVLRVVIADDEPVARATLRNLLGPEERVEVVAECANGVDGLQVLEQLDLRARPAIVFTTAYDQYAVRAFEARAVDYLLKPFDDARFKDALERAREHVRAAALRTGETELSERIRIHKEGRLELVEVAEIDWIEAADQYVRIHTARATHLMRGSMAELERSLDPARFARVHRSAILALDRVVRLESGSGGNGRALLRSGAVVPVSRSRIPGLRRLLG